MKDSKKKIINAVLFTILGVGLLYVAFRNIPLDSLVDELATAKLSWIFIAACCGVLSHLSRALRWKLLLHPMGYKPRTSTSFYAVMIGYLVNFAVPRLGEIIRPVSLNRTDGIPVDKLIGTVIIERVVDLLMTILIAVAIAVMQFDMIYDLLNTYIFTPISALNYGVLLIVGATLVVTIIILIWKRSTIKEIAIVKKISGILSGISEGLKSIFNLEQKGLFIFHSFFIWSMYFLMSYFIFFSLDSTNHLGIDAGLTTLLFGTAAIIIPIPGGIGTYHTMVPAGLALYGIGEFDGKTLAVLSHGVQMLMIFVVGGISYFLATRSKPIKIQKSDETIA